MLFGVCTRTRLLTYLPRRISANRIAVAPPLCARISMSAPTQTGDKPEPTAAAGGAGAEGQSKSAMKKAAKQAEKQAKADKPKKKAKPAKKDKPWEARDANGKLRMFSI